MNSAILLALIKDSSLSITDSLNNIPYIHAGYVKMLLPEVKKDGSGDREDSETTDRG